MAILLASVLMPLTDSGGSTSTTGITTTQILVGGAVIGGFVGLLIGQRKGRAGTGLLLGMFLGVIGWLIVAALKPIDTKHSISSSRTTVRRPAAVANEDERRVRCPLCAEKILPEAVVCKHCGREIPPATLPSPPPGTPGGWLSDPSTRHPDRWWNGRAWTDWVRDKHGGTRYEDPPFTRV